MAPSYCLTRIRCADLLRPDPMMVTSHPRNSGSRPQTGDHGPASMISLASVERLRPLQVTFACLRSKAGRIAFPDDSRMLEHIDPIGVRQRIRDVLLAEQHRNWRGLAHLFQRFRKLFEDD